MYVADGLVTGDSKGGIAKKVGKICEKYRIFEGGKLVGQEMSILGNATEKDEASKQ